MSRRFLASLLLLALSSVGSAVAQDVCEGISPVEASDLRSVVVADGLTGRPLLVTAPPGDRDRIFIVEQDGYIWIHKRGDAPGVLTQFLDVSGIIDTANNEQGLLGLAFDPDYENNGAFYINYTRPGIIDQTVVARYQVDPDNPDQADPDSPGRLVIVFNQTEGNHNGGHLEFGPDGYLYIGAGDGGGASDQHGTCGNGQNTGNLLGTLLRIDPNQTATGGQDCGAGNYTVPDNELADGPGGDCDEIWAYGLRNPWRYAFDRLTGDLYIADVGQFCWEEINFQPGSSPGGENYGWRQMEGTHCFNNSQGCNATSAADCTPPCDDPSLTDAILDYSHSGGACSITGGFVYRGCRMTNIQGEYFYGDYCSGIVESLTVDGSGAVASNTSWTGSVDPGGALAFGLTSFGLDGEGELYVVDRGPGEVRKVLPLLSDLEVSGTGVRDAEQFLLDRGGNWTWEDLAYNSDSPVGYYQIHSGTPSGQTFSCIHSTNDTEWVAGDPVTPGPGQLIGYVVTAVEGSDESSAGAGRSLTSSCGAP